VPLLVSDERGIQACKFLATWNLSPHVPSNNLCCFSVRRLSSYHALKRRKGRFPINHAAMDLNRRVRMASTLRCKKKAAPKGGFPQSLL